MTGPRFRTVMTVAGFLVGLMAATSMSLAQVPPKVAFIAILEPGSAAGPTPGLGPMKEGLAELGWVEGRTARFETRYADWHPERMIEQARELVRLQPDVLYTHSTPAVLAAMQSTKSIPIVGFAADLVGMGAVKSLANPGGNITGMTGAMHELDQKRLEVLKETVPSASRVADLVVPGQFPEPVLRKLDDTARLLGLRLQRVAASEPSRLDAAFSNMAKDRVQAVFVRDGLPLAVNVDRVTALAFKHRLPAISQIPRFADSGGLLQYGADNLDMIRRSATHIDKILKGAKPGDLPVEQPTKVALTVNLRTARALGLTIPPSVLARADQIIQ